MSYYLRVSRGRYTTIHKHLNITKTYYTQEYTKKLKVKKMKIIRDIKEGFKSRKLDSCENLKSRTCSNFDTGLVFITK